MNSMERIDMQKSVDHGIRIDLIDQQHGADRGDLLREMFIGG